jgi:hypothetical protein
VKPGPGLASYRHHLITDKTLTQEGNPAMNSPRRPMPPGSTPLRELAHAVAGALTLPSDVADREEIDYLRAGRDRARIVLFAMRRIIADHEIENDPGDVLAVATTIRDYTSQLAAGQAIDPVRAFAEAIIATLTLSPVQPVGEKEYLQVARQPARRVLLACRLATQHPFTDDHDLAAATGLLGELDASDEATDTLGMIP